MKNIETQKLYHSITNIEDTYIREAQTAKKRKKPVWLKWEVAVAFLCLICVSAIIIPNMRKGGPASDNGLTIIPDGWQNSIVDNKQTGEEQEKFVPITSLLASESYGVEELAAVFGKVPIGQYTGVYEKVRSVESAVLSKKRGSSISGTEDWYYVFGHTDMQYLIRNQNEEYSLWKFSWFDSGEYPYCDVLELVYQIDSADAIREIVVNPATMDNTDGGKALQAKIGTYVITDREEISTIYQILASLTCYGYNHWGMIDYGNVEAPADAELSSHRAVLLGRYLSIVTDYGNEIDGLKYTAVSDMFYEFAGVAYNRLSTEQAERVYEILGITEDIEELQNRDVQVNDELSESQSTGYERDILLEAENPNASLEDVNELSDKIIAACMDGELPFVMEWSVYEDPINWIHIVVTSNSESDLQKLKELDFIGGVLEIEYVSSTVNSMVTEY